MEATKVELSRDVEKNKLLLDLLKENWTHGRHLESERLQFTSFYGAIVAGSLSIIGDKFDLRSINSLSVLLFLLVFSVLGFMLSRKWGNIFDNHMDNVKDIVLDLSEEYREDITDYVETQKHCPNSTFLQRCKRTKNLFNSFYVITISVWTILLAITLFNIFGDLFMNL